MTVRIAAIFAALAVCATAQAAEDASPTSTPDPSVEDVVVVNGVRHPVHLRLQMLDAEQHVYDVFNQLNDDAQFNISCSRGQVAGTRLSNQVCQPRFERDALALAGQDYLAAYRSYMDVAANLTGDPATQNYSPPTMIAPSAIIPMQHQRMQRKMREIAEEHPEFRDALVEYVDLKVRYSRAATRVDE